jgi:hypothetical protein
MQYINCLEREYEDTNACYSFVEFPISRYRKHWHTINFESPVTEKTAIKAVEEYFSQSLSDEDYEKIRKDLFMQEREYYTIRGDAIGDAKFLEDIDLKEVDGKVGFVIFCGS